jgi:CDP-diacylglycerol--serine O-phosphatidyltransferase
MSRRSGVVPGPDKQSNATPSNDGSEKQKMLLSADTGHFSMVKYVSTRAHQSTNC